MLAWVTNSPDLTDGLLSAFGEFVGHAQARRRAGRRPYPVVPGAAGWAALVRSPTEEVAGGAARRPRTLHAAAVRRLRRGAARDVRGAGCHGRALPRQHPRHRGRQRGALPDRDQPARADVCRRAGDGVGLRPLPRRGDARHDDRPLRHERLHGRGPRRRPAADLAGVRGRVGRLRRRVGPAVRPLDGRPQDPAVLSRRATGSSTTTSSPAASTRRSTRRSATATTGSPSPASGTGRRRRSAPRGRGDLPTRRPDGASRRCGPTRRCSPGCTRSTTTSRSGSCSTRTQRSTTTPARHS